MSNLRVGASNSPLADDIDLRPTNPPPSLTRPMTTRKQLLPAEKKPFRPG